MFHKYSPSKRGFYRDDLHAAEGIPRDVVEITEAEHADLMQWQCEGKEIVPDANGRPIAVKRAAPTEEQLTEAARLKRDRLLSASDWTQLPDVPEATRKLWANYRQTLRDITSRASFPRAVEWPKAPNELGN